MESWIRISLLLSVFGFLKEFRPSEPFITPYLTDYKNFTVGQVNHEIYPIGTYSYLSVLVLVFLITDLLRYRPVIIVMGMAGVVTWSLLLWGTTVRAMQVVEFTYGVFMASEVAYFTYMYAQVERDHYQRVTSHTRAAFLLGRSLSGVVSQLFVLCSIMDYYELNYVSLAAESVATVWAFLLPPAGHSMYFHRKDSPIEGGATLPLPPPGDGHGSTSCILSPSDGCLPSDSPVSKSIAQRLWKAYRYLWEDFAHAYTNPYVVKWSVWWAVATCGFLQALTYIQVLWDTIMDDEGVEKSERVWYNGAVEAAYTLVGAGTALVCGWLKVRWQVYGELMLALCSSLQGVLLFLSAGTSSMGVAYTLYIMFGVLYHTVITIATSEVAQHIRVDSSGLVFGVNTFFALVVQAVMTAIVVDRGGLGLGPRRQFQVYGGYFAAMGVVFLCLSVWSLCCVYRRRTKPM